MCSSRLLAAFVLFLGLGCGASERGPQSGAFTHEATPPPQPAAMRDNMAAHGAAGAVGGEEAAQAEAAVQRKIIYTAQIELLVEDFDNALQALTALVKSHKDAYVATSDL